MWASLATLFLMLSVQTWAKEPELQNLDQPTPRLIPVRVVDRSGQGLTGATLEFRELKRRGLSKLWRGRCITRATTGEEGRTEIAVPENLVVIPFARYELVLMGIYAERPKINVDLLALNGSELVLVAPPRLKLDIRVQTLDQRIAPDGWRIWGRPSGTDYLGLEVESHEGLAQFNWIEAGVPCEFSASPPASVLGKTQKLEFKEGVNASESKSILILVPEPEPAPILEGRLLDEHGQPWQNLEFGLLADRGQRNSSRMSLARILGRTDQDGRFRVYAFPNPFWRGHLQVRAKNHGIAQSAFINWGPIVVSKNDFGDVVCKSWPLLVRGRLLDEKGRPIAGQALLLRQHPNHAQTQAQSAPPGSISLKTDEQGRFEWRSEASAGPASLLFKSLGFEERLVEFAVGQDRLDIVSTRLGLVKGRLDWGTSRMRQPAAVLRSLDDGLVHEAQMRATDFVFEVPAGRYQLGIRQKSQSMPEDLATGPEIGVQSGALIELGTIPVEIDLPLVEIDFNPRFRLKTAGLIEMVDPRTNTVDESFTIISSGAQRFLHLPRLPYRLRGDLGPFRRFDVLVTPRKQRIELEPGLPMEVRSQGPEFPLPESRHLVVRFFRDDRPDLSLYSPTALVVSDESPEVEGTIPAPGRYRVRCFLQAGDRLTPIWRAGVKHEELELDEPLVELAVGSVLQIDVSPERFAAALQRLENRRR